MALHWACGICTIPARRETLLAQTINSLKEGGFDRPHLFVDGCREYSLYTAHWPNLEVTLHYPKLQASANFLLALAELNLRHPQADRYALFQDDIIVSKNLRSYLDTCKYVGKEYWNLITYPCNQSICPREGDREVVGWFTSNQLGKGAQALVFDRNTLVALLGHSDMINRMRDARGWQNLDGAVVTALKKLGYKEYVHNPSLVFHTGGHNSSMGHPPQPDATSFRGENFDALQLVKERR